MKTLFFFILSSFTAVSLASATPAPVSGKSPAAGKTIAGKSTAQEKKKVAAPKKKAAATQKYKVRAGDNLSTIAKRHGMKLSELQRLNGLQNSRLKIGQILIVSGKAQKSGNVPVNEIAEESGLVISQIALPNAEGLFADSQADAGVEPIARTYLSIPYRYGAQSRKSTDCSGFVQQVFREFDIRLPRTAREQYQIGKKVDRSSLASGDLLFFRTRARKQYPTHVGIYLGNGKMIHASSRQRKVVISDVNHPYYVKRYVGAKRTATFLPGEIDLEMLARQVTGAEIEAPLTSAIIADVGEESETLAVQTTGFPADMEQGVVLAAGYDGGGEELGDEADDFDDDIEPEAEAIIPAPQLLGVLPLTVEEYDITAAADYAATSVSSSQQPER